MEIDVNRFLNGAITKAISVPGTYTEPRESQPWALPTSSPRWSNGTISGVDIMVFILVLGGLIGVVNASGAFEMAWSRSRRRRRVASSRSYSSWPRSWFWAALPAVSKKRLLRSIRFLVPYLLGIGL